jgi:hypothetical protein
MQLTEAQLKANRENAQLSTGPTSSTGKRKVSMNAIKHGFAGQTCIVPAHEAESYRKHFESFREEYHPVGPTEAFLVQSLAEFSWSTQQIRAQSNNITAMSGNGEVPHINDSCKPATEAAIAQARNLTLTVPNLNSLGIYEQRKMRLFMSTRKELLQIQTERKAREKEELEEAALIRKATKAAQSAWVPIEDGFVCSLEEIDRHIRRTDRLLQLRTAA